MASSPHKDPRPQNLVPIGGLERQLRHRLGGQQLLYLSLAPGLATAWSAPTNADFHVGSSAATWTRFHLPSRGQVYVRTSGNSRLRGHAAIIAVAVDQATNPAS